MGRTVSPLSITPSQREELLEITRSRTVEARFFLRARIVLMAADGRGNSEIADALGIHRNHVPKWRARFDTFGVSGLADKPRSGKPSTYTEADRHRVVTLVCTAPTKGLARWSVRALAKAARVSENFVHRVLKSHDLHPHRLRTFNFSPDPELEDVRDEPNCDSDASSSIAIDCISAARSSAEDSDPSTC